MTLTAPEIKTIAHRLGADLCGLADTDRFRLAPVHPTEILPSARSVIVLARRFLPATLACASTIPYTIVRNQLTDLMDRMTLELCMELDRLGTGAIPVGAIGPTDLDPQTGRHRGLLSLKHAAELAGLGRIGRNTLLVNDRFGNMIWLGAVITDAVLEPDPLATYETCPEGCRLCIQNCPAQALGTPAMNQRACWDHAFGPVQTGEWRISCHACRSVCPLAFGLPGFRTARTPSRTGM